MPNRLKMNFTLFLNVLKIFNEDNKRPKCLYPHQRLYNDFLSKGFIFAYQLPHHRINNQQWHRKAALYSLNTIAPSLVITIHLVYMHWSSDFIKERMSLSIVFKCPFWFLYKINSIENLQSRSAQLVHRLYKGVEVAVRAIMYNTVQTFKVHSHSSSICTDKNPDMIIFWLHINTDFLLNMIWRFTVEHLHHCWTHFLINTL